MSSNDNSQNDNSQNDVPSSPVNSPTNSNSNSNTNTTTVDFSANYIAPSGNTLDFSRNIVITDFTLNEVINNTNNQVTNQQGTSADGTGVTHTTMVTDPSNNTIINEDLQETVVAYVDDGNSQPTKALIDEIKGYAVELSCEDFHGKGTIDDYKELFVAASKIATESKQMQLDVDVEGFENFGQAADELSALFTSFIVKLQNVSIIDDKLFLQTVANALKKIVNLSNVFGRFKKTILATTQIQLPKSIQDTRIVVEDVMGDLNCAMNYVNYFVNPTDTTLVKAKLSDADQNVINTAVSTINNWNILCEQGVSISMNNNPDITYLKNANDSLKAKALTMQGVTSLLRSKLASMNFTPQ